MTHLSSGTSIGLSLESLESLPLLDRDQSILAFNERVFDSACRVDVPLLERLRYLCIVSSNLDEFFEVRAEPHLIAKKKQDHDGAYSVRSFDQLAKSVNDLVNRQYSLYNLELLPAFAKRGIRILSHSERNKTQAAWVRHYFQTVVKPLLIPVGLDPSNPFPQVANKSLNFIIRLCGRDAFGRENDIAIVKVPRVLPRLIRLPKRIGGKGALFVSLSSVVRSHLNELFPGREVSQFSQFRVTRHSDLAVDEEDVKNLRAALRQGLQQRHYGNAVRLEVSAGCSDYLCNFLLEQFELPMGALYCVPGPVNLVRMGQLVDLIDEPCLRFPPFVAGYPQKLSNELSIFERLRVEDVLIHQPYESFDAVLHFLREAVHDPDVLIIKQTIYRTGSNSELMELLRQAVAHGKEVTVVLELKARFDEEVNINWAEKMESIGVQVLYGVMGLKTHAKMMLVTRKEGIGYRSYAHLSTGNYNPVTARLYSDFSHLTANPALTTEVEHVFTHLAGQSRLVRLSQLWVAPFYLHRRLVEKIDQLGARAASGISTRIVAKMNALTDESIIRALMRAAFHGVEIDLIVRGACMLPAQIPGLTYRIRVRSIVGRFLEHARVFYFRDDEEVNLYLSSADWMNRNMLRRVELAWPVLDPTLRQRIIDECLVAELMDTQNAWELMQDGKYHKINLKPGQYLISAQHALMNLHHKNSVKTDVNNFNGVTA
jgi:polyphosphate kinase